MSQPSGGPACCPAQLERLAVLCLGSATAILQVLALREGIAASAGNETIIASLFAAWLLSTAAGASLGRSSRAGRVKLALVLAGYGVLVPATILGARALCAWIPTGTSPSLLVVTAAAFLVLGPPCALAGWLYGALAGGAPGARRLDAHDEGHLSARAYWVETLGAGVTGVVLAVVLLDRVLTAHVMALGCAAALVAGVSIARGVLRAMLVVLGIVLCASLLLLPLDRASHGWQLPDHEVLTVQSSSRGALLRTDQHGQLQFVMQRDPILVPSDHQMGELLGLFPPALHARPARIAFIGVPPGDALAQVLRHPVEQIDVVVGDERLAAMVRAHAPGGNDGRVHILAVDERQWARQTVASFHDMIVMHTGAPGALSAGRLFSVELYRSLRARLRDDGMIVVALPGYGAQASLEQRRFYSTVAASLRQACASVTVLPADSLLLVGSATELQPARLTEDIRTRFVERGITPSVVHETWVRDALSTARIDDAAAWASLPERASSDERPTAVYAALRATMSELDEAGMRVPWVIGGLILLLMLAWASPWSRPVPYAVATTGLAGLALQLVLMLVYQTAVAALFRDVALVTAAFMLSSCAATWWASKSSARLKHVLAWDALQIAAAATIALSVPLLIASHGLAARLGVAAAAMLVGASTGAQLAVVSRLPGAFASGVGGALYAVDLLGAALAATLVYSVVVPRVGLAGTVWIVALIKASSSAALALRGRIPATSAASRSVPVPIIAWMLLVALMCDPFAARFLRAWTLDRLVFLGVLVALASVLLAAFLPTELRARIVAWQRRLRPAAHRIGISPHRIPAFALLLPLAALPVGRCYFVVPFVFCHVCPRPCVFGVARPYVVTTALLGNLGDRRFCEHVCPLGRVQSAASLSGIARKRTGRLVWTVRLVLLALVAIAYWRVREDYRGGNAGVGWFAALYGNDYAVSAGVLVTAGLLLAVSFVLRRPFCEGICPIGAASDLLGRVEKRWVARRSGNAEGS